MKTITTLSETVLNSILEWLWTYESCSHDHIPQWSKRWVNDTSYACEESNLHSYTFSTRLVKIHPLVKATTCPIYRPWCPYFFNFKSFSDCRLYLPSYISFVIKSRRQELVWTPIIYAFMLAYKLGLVIWQPVLRQRLIIYRVFCSLGEILKYLCCWKVEYYV